MHKKYYIPGLDDNGRICRSCDTYKLWDQFHNQKVGVKGKNSSCKDCRKTYINSHYEVFDFEKQCQRMKDRYTFNIGDKLAFLNPVVIDGNPREDIREVVEHRSQGGYIIYSELRREKRQFVASYKESKHYTPYYKIKTK